MNTKQQLQNQTIRNAMTGMYDRDVTANGERLLAAFDGKWYEGVTDTRLTEDYLHPGRYDNRPEPGGNGYITCQLYRGTVKVGIAGMGKTPADALTSAIENVMEQIPF